MAKPNIKALVDSDIKYLERQALSTQVKLLSHYRESLKEIYFRLEDFDVKKFEHRHLMVIQNQLEEVTRSLESKLSTTLGTQTQNIFDESTQKYLENYVRLEEAMGDPVFAAQLATMSPVLPQEALTAILVNQNVTIKKFSADLNSKVTNEIAKSITLGEGVGKTISRLRGVIPINQKKTRRQFTAHLQLIARMETNRAKHTATDLKAQDVAEKFPDMGGVWLMVHDHIEKSETSRNHPASWAAHGTVKRVDKKEKFQILVSDMNKAVAEWRRITGRKGSVTGILWEKKKNVYEGQSLPLHFNERGATLPWHPTWQTKTVAKHPQGPIDDKKKPKPKPTPPPEPEVITPPNPKPEKVKKAVPKKKPEAPPPKPITKKVIKKPHHEMSGPELRKELVSLPEIKELELLDRALEKKHKEYIDSKNQPIFNTSRKGWKTEQYDKYYAAGAKHNALIKELKKMKKQNIVKKHIATQEQREMLFTKEKSNIQVDFKGFKNTSRGNGKIAAQAVEDFRRMLGSKYDNSPGISIINKKGRAGYGEDYRSLIVGTSTDHATIIHEMSHWLEYRGNTKKAVAFLERRTKGERFEDISKVLNVNVMNGEMVRKDKFISPYTGKSYYDGGSMFVRTTPKFDGQKPYATEIISTGMEMLYENPAKFAKDDPDHFDFIMEILRR